MKKMFLLILGMLALALNSCEKEEPSGSDPNDQALPAGWEVVATPALPRNKHSAVLLADGRVLITGGEIPVPVIATKSCEIYDPVTNSWTPAAPMHVYRMLHSSILLNDGRVLVMGGYDAKKGGEYLKNGEVYDPVANTWTLTPSVVSQIVNPSLVIDTAGNVIFNTYKTLEAYDPITNTITPIIGNPDDTYFLATSLQLLKSGKILYMGGGGSGTGNQHNESRYLYEWNTFLMNKVRAYASSIELPDGRVLLFGGKPTFHVGDIFDPVSEKWTLTGSSSTNPTALRLFHTKPDKVIAFGDNSVEEFTISSETWTRLKSPADIIWGGGSGNIAVVQLNNGKLFITGAFNITTKVMDQRAFLFTP